MKLLLKNLLFTLLAPGTVAGLVPWLLTRGGAPAAGPLRWLGAGLGIAGGLLYAWCVWDFASFGRGTPAPVDAPRRLVVRGPYRVVRNPMYLAVLAVVGGWAALFAAPVVLAWAALVGTAFHLFVVLYEEPHLRRTFGDEHDDYCRRVSRWRPRRPRAVA